MIFEAFIVGICITTAVLVVIPTRSGVPNIGTTLPQSMSSDTSSLSRRTVWIANLLAASRKPKASTQPSATDPAELLDLTAAMLDSGIGLEAALARLGECVASASPLRTVHRGLTAGMNWDDSWAMISNQLTLQEFGRQLRFAYSTGAPTAQMLRSGAKTLRADRRHQAESKAQQLEVAMMLPLGACFLPAFVLLGIVPVVISMIPDTLGF